MRSATAWAGPLTGAGGGGVAGVWGSALASAGRPFLASAPCQRSGPLWASRPSAALSHLRSLHLPLTSSGHGATPRSSLSRPNPLIPTPPNLTSPRTLTPLTNSRVAVMGAAPDTLSPAEVPSPANEELTPVLTLRAKEPSMGELLRPDFPILRQEVAEGVPLVYLDSGATSQKPRQVLEAMDAYYTRANANVHRGVHTLSALATEAFEGARDVVADFVNAGAREEIVFTRNASEAVNLVAYAWGSTNLGPGDEVVLTVAEHHSNIVPWQLACQRTGAELRFAPLRELGEGGGEEVDVERLLDLITPRTKLVGIHHISNVFGSEMPVAAVVERARAVGARVLLDACQSVPHMPVDVQSLGVDFLVASAHKMMGPTGIGFLYAPLPLLESIPPFLGGGDMIIDVFLDHSTFAPPPAKFEAGTPAIAEAIGLGAAIEYMRTRVPGGMSGMHRYEMELVSYLYDVMRTVPGVRIYGPPPPPPPGSPATGPALTRRSAALCAFNVEGIHPTDLSTFLDQQHGIAIRSGHHCAQPLHRALGVSSSARVSLHCYNTKSEIDRFIAALKDAQDFFVGVPSF